VPLPVPFPRRYVYGVDTIAANEMGLAEGYGDGPLHRRDRFPYPSHLRAGTRDECGNPPGKSGVNSGIDRTATMAGRDGFGLRQVNRCPGHPPGSGSSGSSRFLEEEIWPLIPPDELGRPLSKAEREEILGFGEHGA
jgi:hypothetical protein